MTKSSKASAGAMLSGVSVAHAIKNKMGTDYNGLMPPYFGIALTALLSTMLCSFLLLMLYTFTFVQFSTVVVLVDAAVMFIVMSQLLKLVQGRVELTGIKLAQAYSGMCIAAGVTWLYLTYNRNYPLLLTVMAALSILMGLLAVVIFSTKRFKKMMQYQQKVWKVKQEVLEEMKTR